jgi:trans-aconitate 2-methyltransferase
VTQGAAGETTGRDGGWDPAQYGRFADQRSQAFFDLVAMLEPARFDRAVDLGCGSGELTARGAELLRVAEMTGIDSSSAMLAQAAAHATQSVHFAQGDLADWTAPGDHDLVLASASLHWVPDHPAVLRRWTAGLAPGGQLAVQVPANAEAHSHTVAVALAEREPYRSAFGPAGPPPDPVAANVLAPKEYAQLLYRLGYEHQRVVLRIYPHLLEDPRQVVEWVKGSILTRFRATLPGPLYERFLTDYEAELLAVLDDDRPYFFPFARIFFWGRRPG